MSVSLNKLVAKKGFSWTFNLFTALLGPIWFGMRALWNWALPFLILETFAVIQIIRGLFGDLGANARECIAQIEGTLNYRREHLASAIENNADNIDVFKRTVESHENAIGAFLAYMGLLGFWGKAMTTLALLGTTACISIAIGIPPGMFCARRPKVYAFIRPIMDFMQTMPAFLFHDSGYCIFWYRQDRRYRNHHDL